MRNSDDDQARGRRGGNAPEEDPSSAGGGARVLLVDADAALRQRCAAGLAGAGYEVEEAAGGLDAVARCRRAPRIDVLVLDVRLPDLDGLAVMRRVLEDRPDLPVVIHTEATGLTGDFATWCADAYLVKTGESGPLAACLDQVRARRAAVTQNAG